MDVFEAVQERRSIRTYNDTPVPREKLEKILEAGRRAPSAGNVQPWHFNVVTDSEKKKSLSKGRYAKFVNQAPVVIVACGDKESSADWYAVDVSLTVENMILTAVSESLSTWRRNFDEKEVKETLKIPEKYEVIVLLTVGYSQGKIDLSSKILHLMRSRKTLAEVTSQETFDKPFDHRKSLSPKPASSASHLKPNSTP